MESNSRELYNQALKFENSVCTLIQLIARENRNYEVILDQYRIPGAESVSRNDVRHNDRRSNPDCIVKYEDNIIFIDAKTSCKTSISKNDIEKSRQDAQARGVYIMIITLEEECTLQDSAYKYCKDNDIHLIQLIKAGRTIRNTHRIGIVSIKEEYINTENMNTLKVAIEKSCIPTPSITFTRDDQVDRECEAVRLGESLEKVKYNLDGTVDKRCKPYRDYIKFTDSKAQVSNYNHEAVSGRFRYRDHSSDSNSSSEERKSYPHTQYIPQRKPSIKKLKTASQPSHDYNLRSRSNKQKPQPIKPNPPQARNPPFPEPILRNEFTTLNNFEESVSYLKVNLKGMEPEYNHSDNSSTHNQSSSSDSSQTQHRRDHTHPYQSLPESSQHPYRNTADTQPLTNSSRNGFPIVSQNSIREYPVQLNRQNIPQDSSRYPINNPRSQEHVDYPRREINNHIPRLAPNNPSISPQAIIHEQTTEVLKQMIKKPPSYSQNCSMSSGYSQISTSAYGQSRSYSNSESMFFSSELERIKRNTSYYESGQYVSQTSQPEADQSQYFNGLMQHVSSSISPHVDMRYVNSEQFERGMLD